MYGHPSQVAWTQGGPLPSTAFSLRFIFTGSGSGREVSGLWSSTAVMEVLKELEVNGPPAALLPSQKASV